MYENKHIFTEEIEVCLCSGLNYNQIETVANMVKHGKTFWYVLCQHFARLENKIKKNLSD